jgi:asparagine N-glycosylation enzyme membrane subunit Stt3
VAEALVYLSALALFGFVLTGSALLRQEMLVLATIPPVFLALIMGFTMGLYAQDQFGLALVCLAVAVGVPAAWWCSRRFGGRDLLISIYLAWAVAMVLSLVGFGFPDRT